MKKIIFILILFILIMGCAEQQNTQITKEEIPSNILEQEKVVNDTTPPEAAATEKTETPEPQNTVGVEVYNPETGKNEIVEMPVTNSAENTMTSAGDELLKTICKNSLVDYPEWSKSYSDIIAWENLDKVFHLRNSPEEMTIGLSSPVQASETLMDMDFVSLNEVSYAKTTNNKWQIALFGIEGMGLQNNHVIYEKAETVSSLDLSALNKKEFLVFYVKDGRAFLNYVDTSNSQEEILLETSVSNTPHKLAVSPKTTYAYLLYDHTLRIFEIFSKKIIAEINSVSGIVWLGDTHLLYSNKEGTYLYDVVGKKNEKVTMIEKAETLAFNPKAEGVIGYTSNSETKVKNCQNGIVILGSYQPGKIETFASEKTAILTKEDLANSGYWRPEGDWYVKLSDQFSVLATVWSKY